LAQAERTFDWQVKLAKLVEQRLVGEVGHVTDVVERLALLVAGGAAAGFARVDPLQDAEATEILEGQLQALKNGGSAGKEMKETKERDEVGSDKEGLV
jgi:hypothetical protein